MKMDFTLSQEWITYAAGIFLSLLLNYLPKLESWYALLDGKIKALIMLGLLLLVSIGIVALSCAEVYALVECSQNGIVAVVEVFVAAAIANQTTFAITKKIPLWKSGA